jgi:hypothetical protein
MATPVSLYYRSQLKFGVDSYLKRFGVFPETATLEQLSDVIRRLEAEFAVIKELLGHDSFTEEARDILLSYKCNICFLKDIVRRDSRP